MRSRLVLYTASLLVLGGGWCLGEEAADATLEPLKAAEEAARQAVEAEDSIENRWVWVRALAHWGHELEQTRQDEKAAELFRRALKEVPADPEEDPPELVAFLHDSLGRACQNSGDFEGAETHLVRAVVLRSSADGAEARRNLGISQGHLGLLQLQRGRYAEAEGLFRVAYENTPGDDKDLLAHRHDCFARYYLAIRAEQRATEHLEKAVKYAADGAPPGDSFLLDLRINLALYGFQEGEPQRALPVIEELLEGELGETALAQLRKAALLGRRGTIRFGLGEFAAAEGDISAAVRILSEAKGDEHPALAVHLLNLGSVRLAAGNPAQAIPPLERARDLVDGLVEDHHQLMVEILYLIAACHLESGNPESSSVAVAEARSAAGRLMGDLIAASSERELLTFREEVDLHSIVCRLGDAGPIAESLLNGKGRIMEAVLDRRTGPPERGEKLAALRQRLDELLFSGDSQKEARIAQLREAIRVEEQRKMSAAPEMGWRDVQKRLGEGEAFVDYVRYRPAFGPGGALAYGAVVIAERREPVWVPLADERVARRIIALHKSLAERSEGRAGLVRMVPLLESLHAEFWEPVADALPPGTREVVVCPEGLLHLLPFAVLRKPGGGFLCEEVETLRLVHSGRSLVAGSTEAGSDERPWLVLGVSRFDTHREALRAGEHPGSGRWRTALERLDSLPKVRDELEAIRRNAPAGSRILLDSDAEERALRRMSAVPDVLHLASHGFHLSLGGSRELAASPSAMYEHGILLWLDAAKDDDGILFPEEAAGLNLRGTRLVTLSTCRSALGQPVTGEGVLGLRRGFAKAGVRHILGSLWEIPDASTAAFMERFYGRLAKGEDPGRILWRLQSTHFRELGARKAPAAEIESAILRVGGFVLTSPGGLE